VNQSEWDDISPDLERMFLAFIGRTGLDIDVQDVLQDTWMIAHEHYDHSRGSLYAFCTKVGHNLIKRAGQNQNRPRKVKWAWHEARRLEAQTDELSRVIEKQIRLDQWDMVQALMTHKHSMEARVLWAMYEFIIKHDKVPTLQQTADIVGVSHTAVWLALKNIVQEVEGQLVATIEEAQAWKSVNSLLLPQ
jgi:DNA-directed RNA polymerase specialized sigma24 family protein